MGSKSTGVKPKSSPGSHSSPPLPSKQTLVDDSGLIIPAPEVQLMAHNKNISQKTNSLILRAVNDVENQFWDYPLLERENSIIIISLYYLQKLFRF